ncbi:hypothetical protein NEOLEDRAFT_1237658 [Neolentinus lepideus HHB14362 ss-1]|uniref:DNA polymerase n=1 Tax=Neolentinus lepideus HHB14362 ss-1 TaxID=1314782 RepID=A0A165VYG0_9AGAM|nr:hypothetical protein NEOLEDRAFT_1237658 [Neolentinus lepideus HHB14362 ss-1]
MSSEKGEPSLRVRINHIDYTLAQPGVLDNAILPRVPVLRIYGDTSIGRKACLHVHQVYPYFFVEYHGKLNPDSVHRYIARLSLSLNHAIAISMKRNPHSPNSQFVRAIVLVKGVHFYGFHHEYSPFLKIHIADPAFVNRAVTILHSGTVMQTSFRVFESHLSYVLQFLCDFGLFGCGWIDLNEVWLRGKGTAGDEDEDEDEELPFRQSPYFRQSRMPLEFDVAAHQILNRHALVARNIHHALQIPAPSLPPEPLVISVRELWEDERQRRAAKGLPPTPSLPLDPSESSRDRGARWIAEARWWEEITRRIEKERGREAKPKDPSWARWIMTTFDSVEALWEPQYRTWRPQKPDKSHTNNANNADRQAEEPVNPFGSVAHSESSASESGADLEADVDEVRLSSQDIHLLEDREAGEQREEQGDVSSEEDPAYDAEEEDQEQVVTEDGPLVDVHDQVRHTDAEILPETSNELPKTPTKTFGQRRDGFQAAWRKLTGLVNPQTETPRPPDIFITPTKPKRFRFVDSYSSRGTQREELDAQPMNAVDPPENDTYPRSHAVSLTNEDIFHSGDADPFVEDVPMPKQPGSPSKQAFIVDFGSTAPTPLEQVMANDAQYLGKQSGLIFPRMPLPENHRMYERPAKRQKVTHDEDVDSNGKEIELSPNATSPCRVASSPVRLSDGTHSQLSPFATKNKAYVYGRPPPSTSVLMSTFGDHGVPSKIYRNPFYSNAEDIPEHSREYAGLVYHLKGGDDLANLEEWDSGPSSEKPATQNSGVVKFHRTGVGGWEYAGSPPSPSEVQKWLDKMSRERTKGVYKGRDGITTAKGVSKSSKDTSEVPGVRRRQCLTVLSLEILALSRGKLVPNPDVDALVAAFYSFQDSDDPELSRHGIIAVENAHLDPQRNRDIPMHLVANELDLLNEVVDQVSELDPDVLVGWEVQAMSWGYLNVRGRTYGLDVTELLSRAPARRIGGGNHQWGLRTTSTFSVVGRHVLNLWRVMRSEYNLTVYTFENVVFNVLQKRVPYYSPRVLTSWFTSKVPSHTTQAVRHISSRTSLNLEILDRADFITKTAEFARIFGVDFFSVISRGSQFKVESFMFRVAKPESFVLLSPSKQDVGKQNAAECMPLIMEPLSAFYNSPLVVLDFQSLYPSIMIAYNYCYSTCLGRVVDFKGRNKFGVSELHIRAGLLDTLKDHIHVAPNGIMYVKPEVRKGLLGRMLTELLETRVMVKQAMKSSKDDKILSRVLDARQLGLKYIANVTYGYTSATYSGRMPAVEIADSIVQSGRETLEKAIRLIDSTTKWGAKVVYGDTDSLFIYLKGKTKDQAFRIGHDIADTITRMNPAPVKLKFEKVYLPCVLMAKKRYVGYKYENPDDLHPGFDAKGIETVRRDGIPAQRKMTEDCLRLLFETQDLSKVKEYCCRFWSDILENRISIQDFIFAKEVKMGTYSDKVPPPPGVTVAARRMMEDEANEPQFGERIRYVIVKGGPHSRLVDRAVAPEELLDQRKRLDASYYINRVLIPPLERIFNLMGADVRSWYEEMPKTIKVDPTDPIMLSPKKKKHSLALNRLKIEEHFQPSECLACGATAPTGEWLFRSLENPMNSLILAAGLCEDCARDPQSTLTSLLSQMSAGETRLKQTHEICISCSMSVPGEPIECESLDCPWLFERKTAEEKAETVTILGDFIAEMEELHM